MTQTATPTVPAFGFVPTHNSAEELLGALVAFHPLRVETLDTQNGASEATIARIVKIGETGQPEDLGERPVFWQVVREQVAEGTSPDVPWFVGRVIRPAKAYRIAPLSPADESLARKALAALAG